MTDKKIKIFTISDHPLSPSGVGTQTKYVIEGLLQTGKYQVVSFAGAMKHDDHTPQKTENWGDDWLLYPVDGYGTQDQVRAMINQQKPDIMWFMTDPRFYGWLWEIENEIRANVPMVYYHVWDNYPYPKFNKRFYDSNDYVACISKLTYDIVKTVSPTVKSLYLPHAVDPRFFKKLDPEEVKHFRETHINDPKKLIFFWNNRNARRKQSGTLIFWFKEFLDKVGHDKATLIMHTEPKDVHGQDLEHIMAELGLINGQVMLSREKLPLEALSMMYNMADCTINISDAEGFGLATLESLACETPIIVNMTGGLQEQVTDGKNWFGIGLEPISKAVIGSQEVPYIYEDRLNKEDFVNALVEFYDKTPEERAEMGRLGAEHVASNYNFETFLESWDKALTEVHEACGSWETRTGYVPYKFLEIA
jgi:glycosyltransferase involved in cell wall biosynthesis